MCVGPGLWGLVWAVVPTTIEGFSPLKGLDSVTTSQTQNNCDIINTEYCYLASSLTSI